MRQRPALVRELVRALRALRVGLHVTNGVWIAYLGFAALRLSGFDRDGARRRRLVRWWMRHLLHILNVELRVSGAAPVHGALIAANHISWLDIPVLGALLEAGFVSKQEVRTWPIVGGLAARAGTIFLARGARDTVTLAADHLTWTLHQGRAAIIFPEGTTTDGGNVRRFHARLFQAAVRTRAPVQAVALSYPCAHDARAAHPAVPFVGDTDLITHLWRLLGEERLVAQLHFCAPLVAVGRARRALAEQSRTQVAQALGLEGTHDSEPRQSDVTVG